MEDTHSEHPLALAHAFTGARGKLLELVTFRIMPCYGSLQDFWVRP